MVNLVKLGGGLFSGLFEVSNTSGFAYFKKMTFAKNLKNDFFNILFLRKTIWKRLKSQILKVFFLSEMMLI